MLEAAKEHTMKELATMFALSYPTVNFIMHPWTKKARETVQYDSVSALSSKQSTVTG